MSGPVAAPMHARWRADDLVVTLVLLVLLLAWDFSGLDRWAMHLVGHAQGFALKDHWLARTVLHDGGRVLGWTVLVALVINVWRPLWAGPTRAERWRWVAVTVLCVLAVPLLKQASLTSCPWDLAEFGGVARYVPHWQFDFGAASTPGDGGPGRCFPSGHATAAFAFLSGWFILRPHHPRSAWAWLAGVLTLGVLFGGAQYLRGAHYPSHTLWTAWLCWAICVLLLGRGAPYPIAPIAAAAPVKAA